MNTAGVILGCVAVAIYTTIFFLLIHPRTNIPFWVVRLGMACAGTVAMVGAIFSHSDFWAGVDALCVAYWFNKFLKSGPRGRGRKIAKAIGAKARALREKLVAAMPKGSPVSLPKLSPVGI